MKKVLFLTIFVLLCTTSIIAVVNMNELDGQRAKINDPLFNYQWYLYNNGQTILRELTDIDTQAIAGVPGIDIGWLGSRELVLKRMQKDVIVAVLDTGLDLEHPDIKANVFRNSRECVGGELPPNTFKDRDRNGYYGDCMGWNFTGKKKAMRVRGKALKGRPSRPTRPTRPGRGSRDRGVRGNHMTFDESGPEPFVNGHGTHVAGIIGAVTNNNYGISGIVPKVKILPIKILKLSDLNVKSFGEAEKKQVENMADGIVYAVKMGAKVINISYGLPGKYVTNKLLNAVKMAYRENVLIVAAAGNNAYDNPLYPCSFKEVLCVGSVTNQGKRSHFSSYGGNVDILAPGDSIVGLLPTNMKGYISKFHIKHFEKRGATSFSTPIVAGVAAIIYGVFDNEKISVDEVRARLVNGATVYPDSALDGIVNIKRSIEIPKSSAVRPIFKDIDYVKYQDGAIKLPIIIKNYGEQIKDVKLKFEVNNELIVLAQDSFVVDTLRKSQAKVFNIVGNIKSFRDLRDITKSFIKVSITQNGKTKVYLKSFEIATEYNASGDGFTFPIQANSSRFDGTTLKQIIDPVPGSSLLEFYDYKGKLPEFKDDTAKNNYIKAVLLGKKKAPVLRFNFYVAQDKILKKRDNDFLLEDCVEFINIFKVDIDGDGNRENMLLTLNAKKGDATAYLSYVFIDNNVNIVRRWKYVPSYTYLDIGTSKIFKFKQNENEILIPMDVSVGITSEVRRSNRHIYYLVPTAGADNKLNLETKIIDTKDWRKRFKRILGIRPKTRIDIISSLPQSKALIKEGTIEFLFTTGRDFNRKYYIVKIIDQKKFKVFRIKTTNSLYMNKVYDVINLNSPIDNLLGNGYLFYSKIDNLRQRFEFLRNVETNNLPYNYRTMTTSTPKVYRLALDSYNEPFSYYLMSYIKDDQFFVFNELAFSIMLSISEKGVVRNKTLGVNKFNFLGILKFRSLDNLVYAPIMVKRGGSNFPAIVENKTELLTDYVQTIVYDQESDELIKPANLNILLPKGCIAKNPTKWANEYHYLMLCKDKLILHPID